MPPGRRGPGPMRPGRTGMGSAGAGGMRGSPSSGARPPLKPVGGSAGNATPVVRQSVRKKPKVHNDYTLAYVSGIVVTLLVIAFVAGWAYIKPRQGQIVTDVAFAKVGPFHIETEGYTYNASLAVQTDAGSARWLKKHQEALNELLYRTLISTHPKLMRTPAGLVAVQQTLTQTINQTLDQPRVQQVLFTDFVLQAD